LGRGAPGLAQVKPGQRQRQRHDRSESRSGSQRRAEYCAWRSMPCSMARVLALRYAEIQAHHSEGYISKRSRIAEAV
jgi:hypothetical protein